MKKAQNIRKYWKKIINLWKIESHKHSESSQQNWTYSQTSEKISLPSVIKWQKITNYCKKDTNFWKKWAAWEKKKGKASEKRPHSREKMPQTSVKMSQTGKTMLQTSM